ncbi:hypothetical protein ABB37_01510 [Leptomonas pyrrhocoris]|uniref:EGF-like domain-containing protein n=1 Tax=Leptomonas pyrrhocoris TaxID=157538 RepID=A0A0M9G8W6_LEPPY|nr:hypothetical protein ABB37_01510 [Leptomonas pyrrhocoris]KPA85123.1 hypothetical protein ABB37_01510 [Leptomonas pyrrhocoris]|eukprot:XP_015663562.1 hypothetical protein ABB37_01510 [Leptomonas pyrrhocoris]
MHTSMAPCFNGVAERHRRRLSLVLIAIAALLLLARASNAATPSGQETCPVSTNAAVMTTWCTARFGGHGGSLTASAWDHNRTSFSCICNANADAAIRIILRSTLPPHAHTGRGLGDAQGMFALADSAAGSSTSRSASRSMPAPASSSSGSFSKSSIPSTSRSSASSSSASVPSALSSSSSDANVTGTCAWSGVFTPYPEGVQCTAITGVCPSSCGVIPPNLCNNAYTKSETCGEVGVHEVSYTCLTCNGRNYTIHSSNGTKCTRYYAEGDKCDAKSTCNGHGCCVGKENTCVCYSDGVNGYYTGSTCNSCQNGYEWNSANQCLQATNKVQFILASIAKTWTMVAPNMAVLFLFVIFGVTRKLNASDRPFDLTGLRRANLSTVQVARRRQQSLFHSKYIPMRPAKSRSFANPHQPQTRGPPAF